jgi:hypothetical protein
MEERIDSTNEAEFSAYLKSGRFEMNLLEHSISSADTKPDKDTSSLVFAREDKHPETGVSVERSWKITFSSEYGRPTAKDDDVLVALMKLSQASGLMTSGAGNEETKVEFSSYQILKILGWKDCGPNYQAVDDALNRLGGVWIVASNYWYDNAAKEYVDRKFGIIDDVYLYERDKYQKARRKAIVDGKRMPKSWIRWSDVMIESFQAGYVAKLDIGKYRSIKNPVGRKLYRYPGKHFWNKNTHTVSLKKLCHEKLGYRKSENRIAKLAQKVAPAIQELQRLRLFDLDHEIVRSYGKCDIRFKKGKRIQKVSQAGSPLLCRLIDFGVSKKSAREAIERHSAERIEEDIKDANFRRDNGLLKGTHAGCLYSMLKSESPWARPPGFNQVRKKTKVKTKPVAQHIESREIQDQEKFQSFLDNLDTHERQAFEKRAIQSMPMFANMQADAINVGRLQAAKGYLLAAMKLEWKRHSGVES